MPRVLDLLRAFGKKTNFRDESAGGYHEESSVSHDEDLGDKSCTELCYLVKHTELHGRSGSHDPWSIRQVGVYHKQELHISSNQQQDTFIILNPSETILHRLKAFKESIQQRGKDSTETWIELQLLVLSSVTEKWKWYISYLEDKFLKISQKPLLASVGENSTLGKSDFAICFADTQHLQEIRDILLRISFMLEINHVVLSAIMRKASSQLPSPGGNGRCNILRALEAETVLQQKRVETLLRRLDGSSTLIRNILDFRGLDALQTNSRTTTELSILAQDDNRMMTGLAYKSRRDAKTLKVLTILALIYLPASFASTLLGMNYIHVDSSNPVKLHFAREMWIFAVLTVVLLVLTMAVWKLWERRYSSDEDLESAGSGVGKHINLKKQE
ncbi:hypothetical protein BDD12DRAFT_892640 [Trichophaea hybrida]|nr:hypothetical protein BDD12DRAFT_892640 [Trichophaea hybrida]